MAKPQTLQTVVATPAWAEIAPVTYTLSDAEATAAREARAVAAAAPAGWVPIVWLTIGVADVALGLVRSQLEPGRNPGFGYFYVTSGLLYVAFAVAKWRSRLRLPGTRQRDLSLRFTDIGIELGGPRP